MSIDLNWANCQEFSDQVLAEGLLLLRDQEAIESERVISQQAGNYLVSLDAEIYYVGEAKNLAKRIRQQFVEKTSTFFRTYAKKVSDRSLIRAFRVRHIEAAIGRKELEEFSIVNTGCSLNQFQRGKRNTVACAMSTATWSEVQCRSTAIIAQGEVAMLSQPFRPWFEASMVNGAGIYVVHALKEDAILYIGESSDIRSRYKTHSNRTYFSALRRHIGTDLLGFSLKERNGKAKYFTDEEDRKVTDFLRSCRLACIPVSYGRFELEEHLIRKFRPQLNRKNNADGFSEES